MVVSLELPSNLTSDQLEVLEKYILDQKKSLEGNTYGKKNYYQDKQELIGKKLIIFKHPKKKKDVWYMRFYAGDRRYKVLSCSTSDKNTAIQRALEKWRLLENHLEVGGKLFEPTVDDAIEKYIKHLEGLVETDQLKKNTYQCKRTSLRKLKIFLQNYQKPSDIPLSVFDDYVKWRRTKNWEKFHKKNPKPPTDLTINKELTDYKGLFEYFDRKKIKCGVIEYPFVKIDWKKSVEKNPAFEVEDWMKIVYYLRTWSRKTTTPSGSERHNTFYRKIFCEFFKVLGNSGLRPHEALLLKWEDIELKSKIEVSKDGERERFIAHINVSPETKTGRRFVICPAGIYFKRIRELYNAELGRRPSKNEYVFLNIGSKNSRLNEFTGEHLSSSFFRTLWYELLKDIEIDKGIIFNQGYTLYSCRAFFINQRLEVGVAPMHVAKLVGHQIRTMEKHYENIQLKNIEPELVELRKKKLSDADFQFFDMD